MPQLRLSTTKQATRLGQAANALRPSTGAAWTQTRPDIPGLPLDYTGALPPGRRGGQFSEFGFFERAQTKEQDAALMMMLVGMLDKAALNAHTVLLNLYLSTMERSSWQRR